MASPHNTATVALILNVNPRLNPDQIKKVIMATASPRDENGEPLPYSEWNKVYGFGKLNAYEAVKLAATLHFGHGPGVHFFTPARVERELILNSRPRRLNGDRN